MTVSPASPAIIGTQPPVGTADQTFQQDQKVARKLFTPLTLRGLTLKNRIIVSPMCMYTSDEGLVNDWHLVHL
ncbi:NADH-dependent flavin oxidoreductase, partial [Dispira simplex]